MIANGEEVVSPLDTLMLDARLKAVEEWIEWRQKLDNELADRAEARLAAKEKAYAKD